MPTARELLEQADALMRRNRSPVADDIPVLTDSIGAVVPPRALRTRAPMAPPPQTLAPEESDTIPMLTDTVAAETPAASAIVAQEGEPSDWLQLGEGEPSAIGEAPDSIAIVPDVEAVELPPFEAAPMEEIELTSSPAEADEAFDAEIAPLAPAVAPAHEPPPSASSLAAAFTDTAAPVPDFAFIEGPALDDVSVLDEATVISADDLEPDPPAEPSPPPSPSPALIEDAFVDATPDPVAAQAAEDARWASVAEEIRMQVLQRIDLFTDTGLREQLGARLQPIVDRASADLVATINQNVGELLRAYVAEAIEREIVNWRQSH